MRRILGLAAVFAVCLGLVGSAMAAEMQPFSAGVKGGLNLSNVWGDDADDTDMKMGFVGGVCGGWNINEIWALQLELLYSMKGYSFDDGAGTDVDAKLDYLEIPLLVRARIPIEGSAVTPSLFVGPSLGILLSAKVDSTDVKDMTTGTDFGVAFGGGVSMPAGPGMAMLDLRYTLGLVSIDDSGWDADIKNGVFGVVLGYSWGFAM